MQIEPGRLRFILEVARAGGVQAAAHSLGVTASAVSQQLTKLEGETGRELVRRTSQGIRLTPDGLLLAEMGEELERLLVEGRQRLTEIEDLTGSVTVAGFESFLATVLVPLLPTWREQHPHVDLTVVEAETDEMIDGLRSGAHDVVILERDAEDTAMRLPARVSEIPLMDEPWTLLVPAGSVIGSELFELTSLPMPWLSARETWVSSTRVVERVRQTVGASETSGHAYLSTKTALALVAAGEGATLLPSLALRGEDLDGITATAVPGLGTRRIVLRHREARGAAGDAIDAVVTAIRDAVTALDTDPADTV